MDKIHLKLALLCICVLFFSFVGCASGSELVDDTVNEVIEEIEVVETITVPQIHIKPQKVIGRNAYVKCSISIVDGDGTECVLDEEASIKIRGNSTSHAKKKPYNIKFSSKTDVLGMGENKKWCLLANCFDKTLLRNMTVFDFANVAGVPFTPDYRAVDVYVDGKLMGSYLITDAIEVGSSRVNIDIDNNEFLLELDYNPKDADCQYFKSAVYNLKFAINEPEKEDLTKEQFAYVQELIEAAETALVGDDFDEVAKYFDIESMVNFYITLELFKNADVATSSTRFHVGDGVIYGGPVWDYDISSGNLNRSYYKDYYEMSEKENGSEGLWATRMAWFHGLMSHEEFRQAVYDRYLELQDQIVNLYEDNSLGMNRIDYYSILYKDSFAMNHNEAGWTVDKVYVKDQLEIEPFATYEEHVAYYRQWLKDRNEWLLDEWGLRS